MTTEDDFQTALDAHLDDWQTRLVFADWLEDIGDPRAEGYRALGACRLRPDYQDGLAPWGSNAADVEGTWAFWFNTKDSGLVGAVLPKDWFTALKTKYHYKRQQPNSVESKDYFTRREAENAAALAFRKLSATSRAKLLAGNTQ